MSQTRQQPTQTDPELGPTEEPAGEDDPLSTDEALELLNNRRRRYALHHLKHEEREVSLGDLAERVAAWENDTTVREVDSTQRKRVYTSLQQFHLPKLDEGGVVNYDERAGVVELTDQADDLDVYLEVVYGADIPWSQYYLGLAGVNAALVAAVGMDAWPLAALPDFAWAAFVVTTLAVSALVHLYYTSSNRLGATPAPPEVNRR